MTRRVVALSLAITFCLTCSIAASVVQSPPPASASTVSRLIGEVFTNGQQLKYLSMLSDEIGSRLTGTAGGRRAEEMMEAEMKRLGLANVHREPFTVPVSWERGTAQAWLISAVPRPLTVASFTWT